MWNWRCASDAWLTLERDYLVDHDDPAVGTILADPAIQISATEERDPGHREERDRKGNQGRMGKEGAKPTPADDGETEIGEGADNGDES
jgi:hypothetical protein